MKRKHLFLFLVLITALEMIACSDTAPKPAASTQSDANEALSIATDAYVYGYSLITTEVTRVQKDCTHRWVSSLMLYATRRGITAACPRLTPTLCIP